MTEKSTVRNVTYDLLRSLGLTTVFGNPGSTEQPFLQEASVIAMADPFAQVTRRPKRDRGPELSGSVTEFTDAPRVPPVTARVRETLR